MTERESGVGHLVSLSADQSEYNVDYDLTVDTQVMGSSETFDPARVVKNYVLTIKPRGNQEIPDDEYTLQTRDEILRVRKVGSKWIVVLP